MRKTISPPIRPTKVSSKFRRANGAGKITALTFGVLVVSFAIAFYAVAWQEPTQAPPEGNVATPLNVSSAGQEKSGGLILNTGGAVTGLIVDKGEVCIGTECRTSWPAAIPSGMIAMFDTSCPSGWTRFAALDGRFPQGSDTYGGTGGSSSVTLSPSQLPPHSHSVALDQYPYNYPHLSAPAAASQGQSNMSMDTGTTGEGEAINILNPYLNVIWCKKD